ncbi:hypothetical protein G169_gp45 [Pseudomonas phage AF]|uniref:hypothetical protein n=1 Tax=Pseudomonas phage AF TaxID=1235689 RepID=UPI00029708C1|nr:hypothetical protein G169_gp45 [Pseudomonas phage AF]AFV50658.1 hypothetical protein AF_045 [Pseudomonas phage AF]
MNEQTREQVRDLIEARFLAVANQGLTCCLQREIETSVDMAGLCGAIDIGEQRNFKERLNRMIERDHQQWQESNRRIG